MPEIVQRNTGKDTRCLAGSINPVGSERAPTYPEKVSIKSPAKAAGLFIPPFYLRGRLFRARPLPPVALLNRVQ